VNCLNPLDVVVLTDYWLAALAKPEEDAVEEHLLGCDTCGTRLREMIVLIEGVRNLAREGSFRMIVSDAFLRFAAEEGLRIREYAPPPGGGVECTVTADDDLLIGRLAVHLSGAKRVDLCICDERGVEQQRLTDIPAQPGAGSIIFQESITFAKELPTHKMIARLVTVDESGGESLLGEYTFNHRRSLPGPGTWQSL
jgi:hypothetical protein